MAAYLTKQFCMTCIDSAYVGNSTYTTVCTETIQYVSLHHIDSLNIRMKKFDEKYFLTK